MSATYKILSNILSSTLTLYAEEITGDLQCGFRRNMPPTDNIFYIRQILDKKLVYNEAVHQLIIGFKKAYDSVIEFDIPMKLVRLTKKCLNETYSTIRVGKNLSDMFPVKKCLK